MGKYEPQTRYDNVNTVRTHIKLNRKTDADIIEFLNTCGNKQGFIKKALRMLMAELRDAK